jgi:hypothetical protein
MGELSWFSPTKSNTEDDKNLVMSIAGDYTFPSSLYLYIEGLFNQIGITKQGEGAFIIFPDAYNLAAGRYTLFFNIARDLSPLVRGDLALIYNFADNSFFLSPTIDWSLSDNLELLFTTQLFFGTEQTEFGDVRNILAARLKWSF